jgi:tRNA G18 (ribose-2'-O)-methylase SpoU
MKKIKNEDLNRLSIKEYKNSKKMPVCIILDNVRSLNNIGSCFRTADAFLIKKMYLTGFTAKPPNRNIERTALGATNSVEWEHIKEIKKLIIHLKKEGWKIILVEQTDKSINLKDFKPLLPEKYVFIFGNEVFGISEDALKETDTALEIPQFGTKHSFNISVSMGIILWDHYVKTTIK